MSACRSSAYFSVATVLTTLMLLTSIGTTADTSGPRKGHVLLTAPECSNVRQTCSLQMRDDFDFIECLSTYGGELPIGCQNIVWLFTTELLKDKGLRDAISDHCGGTTEIVLGRCRTIPSLRPGALLMCLFRTVGDNDIRTDSGGITDPGKLSSECRDFVHRLKLLTFMDLGAMTELLLECDRSIREHQCGRVKTVNHGQESSANVGRGGVLRCMQENVGQLDGKCKEEVLRLSELQGDDIKLNRELFVHCTEDRLRFCKGIPIDNGQKIHKCLIENKSDVSTKCREMLYHHEQLIVQDYQVSRGLVRMCKEDIKRNHCRKSVSSDKDIRLAQILLCLENATRNGTKVNEDCLLEMLTHRKILMEDYRLSPELVSACSDSISQLCKGVDVGGKTIHCLMDHTRTRRRKDRIAPQCQRQLEILLKQVDVVSDWRIDPVLREACSELVSVACKNGDRSRVMSCLMEHLGTNLMPEKCETALLQIQYFVQRDYRLDPGLYRECREDAVALCHAKRSWAEDSASMDPERGPIVLPCLYRYTLQTTNAAAPKLRKSCFMEVMRLMKQRALSVELDPDVEQACIEELAARCSDKTGKGEEMLCLQDNLDSLTKNCKEAVSNYTELQSAHLILNPIIMLNCREVISTLCENDVNTKTGSDVLDCLIDHKNNVFMRSQPKCRATVEHHQLISLKDFHFTFRFKDACQLQVNRYCNNARTKFEVVSCLSEIVRNDTLEDHKPRVPRECRQQLRAQLLQQRENIDLDPTLKKACAKDIATLCRDVAHGNARVLDCLESKRKNLTQGCHKRVFNVERQDLMDGSTDYTLLNACKTMVIKYCADKEPEKAFDCLKKFKYAADFDMKCRLMIVRRMIEQNSDYRLNPALQRDCQQDIIKFCSDSIAASQRDDLQVEIKVIRCLKVKFRERKLSSNCESQLGIILKEAALNYELNPLLTTLCNSEIKQLCSAEMNGDMNAGQGRVEECLKNSLLKGQIVNRACRIEVVELIQEGKADIQTDPLLYRACSYDITTHCRHIDKGDARQLDCMLNMLNNNEKLLSSDCKTKLSQRVEMYNIVKNRAVENFGELYSEVSKSPSKRYFIVVAFTFIGIIFITGMFCGRVIRRSVNLKNK